MVRFVNVEFATVHPGVERAERLAETLRELTGRVRGFWRELVAADDAEVHRFLSRS